MSSFPIDSPRSLTATRYLLPTDSPECLSKPTAYFIYDKPINVTCTVSSYPAVSVILWQWNNSNEVIKRQSVVDEDKASAQLTVQPQESHEDRKLSCWAGNEMGNQTQPCDFAVKVASKYKFVMPQRSMINEEKFNIKGHQTQNTY